MGNSQGFPMDEQRTVFCWPRLKHTKGEAEAELALPSSVFSYYRSKGPSRDCPLERQGSNMKAHESFFLSSGKCVFFWWAKDLANDFNM